MIKCLITFSECDNLFQSKIPKINFPNELLVRDAVRLFWIISIITCNCTLLIRNHYVKFQTDGEQIEHNWNPLLHSIISIDKNDKIFNHIQP